MMFEFLRDALHRHLEETMPFMDQLEDKHLISEPVKGGKPLGEIILHMLRSLEFYMTGLAKNKWNPLSYSLKNYNTAQLVGDLAREVFEKALRCLEELEGDDWSRAIDIFNRPATAAEILLEVIEHSIHHRGQITVYYRLLGIKIPEISYIV